MTNPLASLLAAVHDAHLRQRETAATKRLRACRARMPDQPRPRKARRLEPAAPVPTAAPLPAPAAVSPAPTFQPSALPFANVKRLTPRDRGPSPAPISSAQVAAKAAQLESGGITIYRNEDGQYSAPELTAWYVSLFGKN